MSDPTKKDRLMTFLLKLFEAHRVKKLMGSFEFHYFTFSKSAGYWTMGDDVAIDFFDDGDDQLCVRCPYISECNTLIQPKSETCFRILQRRWDPIPKLKNGK